MEQAFSESNNILNKFGEFLQQHNELLDKMQARQDISMAAELLYNNSIANFGEFYLQTFILFGMYLAANYDEIFGEPVPPIFADFLKELQLSKE